jgi:peptidoglycan/xylan/chitin deacetylase (PgdA/CDA1 family)
MANRVMALLYHDVVNGMDFGMSGFSGKDADEYKLTQKEFEEHISAIKQSLKSHVITQITKADSKIPPVMFTFDDGGVSAHEIIAPILEKNDWRGLFFISSDYIGGKEFLSREQIKDLHDRGHIIGSHSCSHPTKITDCTQEQLLHEWGSSIEVLSEIIEQPVTVASIPGGFYSTAVAKAAVEQGVKYLFTSEPVQKIASLDGCAIIGRFSVKRGDSASVPAEFVSNHPIRMFWQFSYWNIKKVAKAISGPVYPWVRSYYLSKK